MALTEDKVRSLVEEDEGLSDALETIYRAAEDGSVEWADVNDDVSSGHWGRLIEQGVLIEDGDGFRLADEGSVAEVLDGIQTGEVETADPVDEDSSWTKYDKMAALVAVGMFAAYSLQWARAIIGGTIDVVLGPLNQVVPFHVVILIIAVVTGVVTTIVQSEMMDTEKIAKYQEHMQDIQDRRKAAKERGDDEALERIQQEQMEAMGDQAGMIKEQFRPTVWIMLLSIPFFLWIYWSVLDGHLSAADTTITAPLVGTVRWNEGIFFWFQMWIVWYFLCSLTFSNIVRKALNISISPSS